MKYLLIAVSGWLLLALESALAAPAGSPGTFVWLLIPWLAVELRGAAGILSGVVLGVFIDGLSGLHPGAGVAVSVLAVTGLQFVLDDESLSSPVRVCIVSLLTSLALGMLFQTIGVLFGSAPVSTRAALMPVVFGAAAGAGVSASIVSVGRLARRSSQYSDPMRVS
jgi:hypothetical protein